MTYLLFSKILRGKLPFFFFFWEWRGKLLDFKVWGWIVNYPKHKMMKSVLILSFCFYFLFLCVCKTMCFYLKWCIKEKKNTKYKNSTQEKCMWNSEFWLNKNWLIKKKNLETQRMTHHFHNTFITLLYFTLTCKNWHLSSCENIVTTTRCLNIFTKEMLCSQYFHYKS